MGPRTLTVSDAASLTPPAALSIRDGRLTQTSRTPVVLRRTGVRRVHVVQVGGGPLGGDRLALDLDVGPGECLAVHGAAATVVQPGPVAGTHAAFVVDARVGPGAALDWCPEPTVVTDGADWWVSLRVSLAPGARLRAREQLVLGRHGQCGGRVRSDLCVDVDGAPLLATSTRLDGADPALSGPGGLGGVRSLGTLLVVGDDDGGPEGAGEDDDVRWAWTALDGGGALLTAVGTPPAVRRVLGR